MESLNGTESDARVTLSKQVGSSGDNLVVLIREHLHMRVDLIEFLELKVKPFLEENCGTPNSAIATLMGANPRLTKNSVTENGEPTVTRKSAPTIGNVHGVRKYVLANRI
jgi:hypothetical protein